MDKTERFYDFCVPYNANTKVMRSVLNELVDLGYKTIAIEQIFDHSKKGDHKHGSDIFPEPCNTSAYDREFAKKLKILKRLTIIYCETSVGHAIANSLTLRKYNIVAGLPKTDAALTYCCTTFAGDLLTFDPSVGSKLVMNKKNYQIAVNRGLFFELKYSPAICDSSNRKDMIRIAHSYCVRGKTKNMIFSSGAQSPFELRGPYDVANLAFIFGLSEDQGKNAIDRNCRNLFLKAESRRIGKTIMFVRSCGPVVFSDSSDAEDDEGDEDKDEKEVDQDNVGEDSEDENNEEDDDSCEKESYEQPHKKKKISSH